MDLVERINETVHTDGVRFFEEVGVPLLEARTISMEKGYEAELQRGAELTRDALASIGLDARLVNVDGINPLVYAQLGDDPTKPTILVYGHYDVQAADPTWALEDGVEFDPFKPKRVGDIIYGRGTADDKLQWLALAMGVDAARKANGGELSVNVKFLIEGNEEASKGTIFADYVRENAKGLLKADGVVIADCERVEDESGRPTFVTGLKGLVAGKITMRESDPFGLARIITGAQDHETRRATLPGFYDGMVERGPITDPEMLRLLQPKEEDGMGRVLMPERGFDQATHRARRPTVEPLSFNYVNKQPVMTGDGGLETYTTPAFGKDDVTIKITAHGPTGTLHSGIYGGPAQNPAMYLARAASILDEFNVLNRAGHPRGVEVRIDYINYGPEGIATKIHPQGEMQITLVGVGEKHHKAALDKVRSAIDSYFGPGDTSLFDYSVVESGERTAYLSKPLFHENDFTKPEANISYRLVAGQDPDRISQTLERVMGAQGADVTDIHSGKAFMSDVDDPFCSTFVRAAEEIYGKPALTFDSGGSIPITTAFAEIGPTVLYAFGPSDAHIHDRNERIRLSEILKGAKSFAKGLLDYGAKARN